MKNIFLILRILVGVAVVAIVAHSILTIDWKISRRVIFEI
jgi:hypothetical protein